MGLATPKKEMIKRRDGTVEFHFDCVQGHRFHTDGTVTHYKPCDCSAR